MGHEDVVIISLNKKSNHRIVRLFVKWQGLQYANGTFDPSDIECDVQEIRDLLDDDKSYEAKEPKQ